MKEIIYITGNQLKFEVAQKAAENTDISLIRYDLETPEIQSESVEEIAKFSARWAADKLQKPVALSDGGYYITALNGFPGPFIKYINKWLAANDILRLMDKKENRHVEVKDCLAYCEPSKEPIIFSRTFQGSISMSAGQKGTTPISEVFIPENFNKPESEIPWDEMKDFWNKDNAWEKLDRHLKDRVNA